MTLDPVKEIALNEVDFEVVEEDFTRYRLTDGTLLKIKICVLKILESVARGTGGYPAFGLCTSNVLNTLVPEHLKAQPSTLELALTDKYGPAVLERLKAQPAVPPSVEGRVEEIGFFLQKETWQEYKTDDGFLVRVRPIVTKVFKHDKYNVLKEPVYSVPNIQLIQDALRAAS